MINSMQNIDPVIMDLNRYLAEQEQHDIKQEYFHAKAEEEFNEMNYLEIIEYDNNYTDLEFLFDFVAAGRIEEAKAALNNFLETVKDAYIADRIIDLEQEEEEERQADDYMEHYYLEKADSAWC